MEFITFDYVVVTDICGLSQYSDGVLHSYKFCSTNKFIDCNLFIFGSCFSSEDIAFPCDKFETQLLIIIVHDKNWLVLND